MCEEYVTVPLTYCDIWSCLTNFSQHAVKGRHLYVSKPEAGGTFFINASFVDVSDVHSSLHVVDVIVLY